MEQQINNRTEQFEDQNIDIIIFGATNDKETWFRGNDIANILGYKKTLDALSKHVREKNKDKLKVLYRARDSRSLTTNQKNTIYINEAGLYQLIMKNKVCLPIFEKLNKNKIGLITLLCKIHDCLEPNTVSRV